jgi:hypothetical protein
MEIQTIKISEADRELLFQFYGEDLGNDIDFNRLMPVVEKIADIGAEKKGQTIDKAFELIGSLPITSKLEWVYKGVIEFIKWFNQQKA